MKLRLLFLFLLLFAPQSFGQLKPFEDNGNCSIGFIGQLGDTLWQSQFKSFKRIELSNKQGLAEHWIVEKDGNFGLLNALGELVLPIEYQQLEHLRDRYFKGLKQNKYGVVRSNNNSILPFEFDLISTEKMGMDGFGLFRIEKEGKVGFINSDFEVLLHPGDEISSMKNVEKIRKYTWGLVFVYTTTGETGLFDSENFAWIYEPGKYKAVVPFNHNWSCFWINNGDDLNTKWYIVDRQGELVVDQWFDYPNLEAPNHCYIVRRNGKYGILSTHFKDSIPCQYDAITQGRPDLTSYLHVRLGDKWSVYYRSPPGKLSKYTFDHVSEPTLNRLTPMMVFSGDSIGILSGKDEMILELTPREQVINDLNLCDLMQVYITKDEFRAKCGSIETNDDIYRKLSNRNIVEYYTNVSTALTPSVHTNGVSSSYKNVPYVFEVSPQWDKKIEYHIWMAKGGYYSVQIKKDSMDFSVDRNTLNRKVKTEQLNFRYEDGQWKPLTLEGLFIDNFEEKLKEIMRAEMNSKQIHPTQRIDLDSSFESGRIQFYLRDTVMVLQDGPKQMFLSYKQLETLLREPNAFE